MREISAAVGAPLDADGPLATEDGAGHEAPSEFVVMEVSPHDEIVMVVDDDCVEIDNGP